MTVNEILKAEQINLAVQAASKKRALETLSDVLASADPELGSRQVFDRLLARERLGSTGLGHGVAIPHGRVPSLNRAVGALIKVDGGIDYDAPDGQPVDLIFGLLVPEECNDEHLELLAQLASAFDDDELRASLRSESSPAAARETMGRHHSERAA